MTSKSPQPGDILVVSAEPRTFYKKDQPVRYFLEKRVYKPLSDKIQGRFVHAGIFVGKDKVVEGLGRGFVESSFRKATKGKDYIIVRPKRSKKERRKAARFAKKQVGKPYSLAHLFGASLSTAQPDPVRKMISRTLGSKNKERKAYQCAGMVAAAYASDGKPLDPSIHPIVMAPVHLITHTDSSVVRMRVRSGDRPSSPLFPTTRRRFIEKTKSASEVTGLPGYPFVELGSHLDDRINKSTEEYLSSENKMKTASIEDIVHAYMEEELQKIAAHCTPAHRIAKKALKKKKTKTAAMSSARKNLLLGGALGLAAGTPAGAYLGYKREQNRLSPQEQAVVRQAMQQAYRQGNIAMYNRLKAMAQQKQSKK